MLPLFVLLELTLDEVIADIPHDGAAVIVYLMLALFLGFIWYGSRGNRPGGPSAPGN